MHHPAVGGARFPRSQLHQERRPVSLGVTPPGQWALYDTKTDPACNHDLAADQPQRVKQMAAAYDHWWDDVYPLMVARGGDAELSEVKKQREAAAAKAREETQ